MSLLDDVRAHILTVGAPWTTTNVFVSEFSDEPDLACCVYEYPGELTHLLGGGSASFETARFQVVVRANRYSDARQYADALLTSLDAVGDVVWSSTRYLRVMASDTPHPLPDDGHARKRIAVNYSAMKERP
jgi:hypothetical protein